MAEELPEGISNLMHRAGLWARSQGRRVIGVEHLAALIVRIDVNRIVPVDVERWAVIEQLLNEPDPPDASERAGWSPALWSMIDAVQSSDGGVDELAQQVVSWIDALLVLTPVPRPTASPIPSDEDAPAPELGAGDPTPIRVDGELSPEERERLTEPSQVDVSRRAVEFENLLTRVIESDATASALLAQLEGAGLQTTCAMLRSAAAELVLGSREHWRSIDGDEAQRDELRSQVESLIERREVGYGRLLMFWDSLSAEQRERLALRVQVHLGESDVDARGDEVLERLDAVVRAGPGTPGGWDCGRSDPQRVGALLLLAERIARGESVEELHWSCDVVRGRFGTRVGPLARDEGKEWVTSHPRAGMTVFIGPPGSGKSTCLESANLSWPGPIVTTTTKRGEWRAGFVSALLDKGPVYLFDATGGLGRPHPEVQLVRWSPLQDVSDWDSARETAHVIARSGPSAASKNVTDGEFWTYTAYQLITVLVFAASHGRRTMGDVAGWVNRAEESEVMGILARAGVVEAADQFASFMRMDPRTLNSVRAFATTALDPFSSHAVQAVTDAPTFEFVEDLIRTNGTVLVYADGFRAGHTAALYALFIDGVIKARKALADDGWIGPHLMLALDEVANITPLPSLPAVLTEGPGRGVTGIFCLQDLQQARSRWGSDGDLFLSSTGHRLIFPGTTDRDLQDFVIRHSRPEPNERGLGFQRSSDRRYDTAPRQAPGLGSSAELAGLDETKVVVVDPLARVRVAQQVRSFEDADYARAQHEAATIYDVRNQVVLDGIQVPLVADSHGEESEYGAGEYGEESEYDSELFPPPLPPLPPLPPPVPPVAPFPLSGLSPSPQPLTGRSGPSVEFPTVPADARDMLDALGGPIGAGPLLWDVVLDTSGVEDLNEYVLGRYVFRVKNIDDNFLSLVEAAASGPVVIANRLGLHDAFRLVAELARIVGSPVAYPVESE